MTKYDAIIVLGGGRYNDGSLTELSKQRLDAGAELIKKGVSSKIFALGGKNYKTSDISPIFAKSGALIRKEYLISRGLSDENIILVLEGGDTICEAFACRKKAQELNFNRLLIVTSNKHLPRAIFIFKRIFGKKYKIDVFGVPCGDLLDNNEEKEYLKVVRNYFKKFLEDIADPNLETWVKDNHELYKKYHQIKNKFHPPGQESQAYAGVKDSGLRPE